MGMIPRATFHLILPSVIAFASPVSCSTPQSPSRPGVESDAGADSEAGGPSDSGCTRNGDACGPEELCCPPLRGRVANLAQACLQAGTVVLGCRPRPRPSAPCVGEDAHGCWTRAKGAGTEAFFTSTTWPAEQLPDFAPCSADLERQVFEAETKGTCD